MICSTSSCFGWKWSSEDVSCSSVTFTLQEASGSDSGPREDPTQPQEIQSLVSVREGGVDGMNSSIAPQVPTLDLGGSTWTRVAWR